MERMDIKVGFAYIEVNKMLRVSCLSKLGNIFSLNGTQQEIDDFLLSIEEKEGIKLYRIMDKTTKEIIETQDGKKIK